MSIALSLLAHLPEERPPAQPRKTELSHESGMSAEVGQAGGEEGVKVMHLLNSLRESREDLALMTVD